MTEAEVTGFFARHPRFASPLHRSPHAAAGTAADRLAEIAPYIGKSPWRCAWPRPGPSRGGRRRRCAACPAFLRKLGKRISERGPELMARAREEWEEARPVVIESVKEKARGNFDRAVARVRRATGILATARIRAPSASAA